jgi:hypothetical protein
VSWVQAVTADGAVAVTKSDATNDPSGPFVGFYVGGSGDVKVTTLRGQNITLPAVQGGMVIHLAILRVWNSTTSATGIIGLQGIGYGAAT